jgi:hypothetical protein
MNMNVPPPAVVVEADVSTIVTVTPGSAVPELFLTVPDSIPVAAAAIKRKSPKTLKRRNSLFRIKNLHRPVR